MSRMAPARGYGWTRLGGVAFLFAIGVGCLTSTDDVENAFDPVIRLTVHDPFEGARIEGMVIPLSVEVHRTHKDVLIAVDGIEAFTWPEDDHGEVDLGVGTVWGTTRITISATELNDNDGNVASFPREITLVPPGSSNIDYPADDTGP